MSLSAIPLPPTQVGQFVTGDRSGKERGRSQFPHGPLQCGRSFGTDDEDRQRRRIAQPPAEESQALGGCGGQIQHDHAPGYGGAAVGHVAQRSARDNSDGFVRKLPL